MAKRRKNTHKGWPIIDLWDKYENITMHFNDLLIKLRIQALAGVAALSTLIGIFAKSSDLRLGWEVASAAFAFLCLLWIAIWIIDFRYYNRLLLGAVIAILELEKTSKHATHVRHIDLSTVVERAVAGEIKIESVKDRWNLVIGRWAFYWIVFLALIAGLCFCLYQFMMFKAITIQS